MKKIKGTRYAHVGSSYRPQLDAMFDKMDKMIEEKNKRLDEIEKMLKKLMGE